MSKTKLNKKGFTLIELVIVLAIAALILAGVLIAVSGAQKSRRDTQRKNDLSTMASYMEQYASNHQGSFPTSDAEWRTNANSFTKTYIPATSNLKDPLSGNAYSFQSFGTAPNCSASGIGAGPAKVYLESTGSRNYTLTMCLEQGQQFQQSSQ
jgi:prepilin-type N-terminal cleavage/methylation domain-containing protein